jgi:catechol 2,3-dioxygenase-like lactoylglutathione lyase family enzyme
MTQGETIMKRLHVSFGVTDLEPSVRFYTTLFGAEPSVRRPGYAKWLLDDPRVNFVVETLSGARGFGHAGIQVDDAEELEPIFARLKQAEAPYLPEGLTTCCYHKSEKGWTEDPDGIRWEAFHTLHQMETFGTGPEAAAAAAVAKTAVAEAAAPACCG